MLSIALIVSLRKAKTGLLLTSVLVLTKKLLNSESLLLTESIASLWHLARSLRTELRGSYSVSESIEFAFRNYSGSKRKSLLLA